MPDQKCPFCKSSSTVWRGYRYNQSSKKRMKLCTSCSRKFTPDDGFLRMRFDRKDILYVVSLYRKGFSTSEVVLHMARRGVKISRWTVILWNRKADKIRAWKASK